MHSDGNTLKRLRDDVAYPFVVRGVKDDSSDMLIKIKQMFEDSELEHTIFGV